MVSNNTQAFKVYPLQSANLKNNPITKGVNLKFVVDFIG